MAYSDQYYVDEYPNTNGSFGVLGTYVNQTYEKALTPAKVGVSYLVFNGWRLASGDESGVVRNKAGYVTGVRATNTSDIILEAHFSQFVYKLSYSPNGGLYTGEPDNGTSNTNYKSTIVLNPATKYGTDLAQDINVDGVSVNKLLSVTRSGYILRCIALDKSGKKACDHG